MPKIELHLDEVNLEGIPVHVAEIFGPCFAKTLIRELARRSPGPVRPQPQALELVLDGDVDQDPERLAQRLARHLLDQINEKPRSTR